MQDGRGLNLVLYCIDWLDAKTLDGLVKVLFFLITSIAYSIAIGPVDDVGSAGEGNKGSEVFVKVVEVYRVRVNKALPTLLVR